MALDEGVECGAESVEVEASREGEECGDVVEAVVSAVECCEEELSLLGEGDGEEPAVARERLDGRELGRIAPREGGGEGGEGGEGRVLEEGAPVYLGYVTKIVPDDGLIECLLNKGGVAEKFVLRIRQGQPIK